jgi:hypothetical protein
MRKSFTYCMVGLMAAVLAGSVTYALQSSSSAGQSARQAGDGGSIQTQSSVNSFFWDNSSEEDDSGLAKVLKSVMSTKELKVPSGLVSLKNDKISGPVSLALTDADLDFADSDNIKLKTALEAKYSGIDEKVSVVYDNTDAVYFDYLGKKYYLKVNSAAQTLLGIYNEFSAIGMGLPQMPELDSSNLNSLLKPVLSSIGSAVETKTATGYDYYIDLGSLTFGSTTLSGLTINLDCDSNYSLTHIKTGDISINGKLTVGLDLDCQILTKEAFTTLSDTEKADYTCVDYLDTTASSLCTTLADYMDKKNFGAQVNFDFTTADGSIPEHQINGAILGDLSKVASDPKKGDYQVKLQDTSANNVVNAASVYFLDSTLYLNFNNLLAGKIDNAAITDMETYISTETGDDTYENASQEAANTLTIIKNLIGGKHEVPSKILTDFSIEKNGITFTADSKAFALTDASSASYPFYVKIDTADDGTFKDVALKGLKYGKYNFDFSVAFQAFEALDAVDSTKYADYKGVVPLYKTISKIAKAKKFSSSYDFTMKTKKGNTFVVSGQMDADLSALKVDKANLEDSNFGNYHLTMDETDASLSAAEGGEHKLDANYLDGSLYFAYDTNFKNYISKTEAGSLFKLVDTKSDISSLASFGKIGDVVTAIKNSDFLQKDLANVKKGYLTSLESFLSVTTDDNANFTIGLNIPYVFQGTKYASALEKVTIVLDTSTGALTAVSVNGFKYTEKDDLGNSESTSLSFNLKLLDFAAFTLTDTEKATYTCLDHPIQSFINLPNKLEKFGLGVEGSLGKNATKTAAAEDLATISGFANVDRTVTKAPTAGGEVTIVDQTDTNKQNHKVDFAYKGYDATDASGNTIAEGQTVASYNDHMHVQMHNSKVLDIYNQIKAIKDPNLLAKYTSKLSDMSESLPIATVIKEQNYSMLLNSLIPSITVTDSTLTLKVNLAFFDSSLAYADGYADPLTAVFGYDSTKDAITFAQLDGDVKGYKMHIKIALNDYGTSVNPTVLAYNDTTKSQFVDLDNLSLLVAMGIKTTEVNYFELHGVLNLTLSLGTSLNLNALKTYCTAYVLVEDGKTKAYLALNNSNTTDITQSGFYCTEYFIDEDMAYVCQTRNDDGGSNYYSENFKLTRAEILKNIYYYVVDYSLNIEGVLGSLVGKPANAKIYDSLQSSNASSSSFTISKDYSQYVNSAVYTASSKTYALDLALDQIVKDSSGVMSFENLLVDVIHDSDNNLVSINLRGGGTSNSVMTVAGLLNVKVSLQAYSDVASAKQKISQASAGKLVLLARYKAYVAAYNANDSTKNLSYYEVTSITVNKTLILKTPTSRTVKDNGQKATFSAGSSAAFFFYAS